MRPSFLIVKRKLHAASPSIATEHHGNYDVRSLERPGPGSQGATEARRPLGQRVAGPRGAVCGAAMLIAMMGLWGCRTPKPSAPDPPLARLAIYYGWPSAFDGARSPEEAAARIAAGFDVLVLGAGLESPAHPDHERTRQIVQQVGGRVEVYGYVPLGRPSGLDEQGIAERVAAWAVLGVRGVFFDEAGYDFGNTRARQNAAVEAAHRRGLRAFLNAHDPDDVFGARRHPEHNPRGLRSALRAGDLYLYESFALRLGAPEPEEERRAKLEQLGAARRLGVRLFGVTTAAQPGSFGEETWRRVVLEARRAGLDGLGWGEHQYAATDNRMPARPFPPAP